MAQASSLWKPLAPSPKISYLAPLPRLGLKDFWLDVGGVFGKVVAEAGGQVLGGLIVALAVGPGFLGIQDFLGHSRAGGGHDLGGTGHLVGGDVIRLPGYGTLLENCPG